jgi:hypothetical protein
MKAAYFFFNPPRPLRSLCVLRATAFLKSRQTAGWYRFEV